ncbi:GTPase Era [Porticoccaceae bacterium]|nr:GTPase Era [Porticoccaceae bacterium]MDA8663763.1 GTPase Era [Porticoccaceae bacterium]MDA8681736.1 GTPase Era [Porticoccaceae bacterium]MDB2634805.1 GTPase Era [Porticoccaceae bacterium]MDB2664565.1 GTPase Era [Porticoccaceae bacterium]
MTKQPTYCGYVAIIGRPNVGKSTLLNHILGQKLCITSRKPQTTRHTLLGIKTERAVQMIFVDTPGIHTNQERAINRVMNRSAASVIADVDLVIFVLDRFEWSEADEYVAKYLKNTKSPVIVAVNKVDMVEDKEQLLPHLDFVATKVKAAELIPLSALRKTNLSELEEKVRSFMPENNHLYPEDQITDRSERFLAAEIVREKITRQLGAEVPYQVTVEIEQFRVEGKVTFIDALILVERDGQKRIIIGTNGERIKKIGQQARADIESLLDSKVMLRTWVKVRSGWSDDERALQSLGYTSE